MGMSSTATGGGSVSSGQGIRSTTHGRFTSGGSAGGQSTSPGEDPHSLVPASSEKARDSPTALGLLAGLSQIIGMTRRPVDAPVSDVRTHLVYDDGWARRGATRVRGRAFRDGRLLRAGALASLVESTPAAGFDSLIEDLNGFFAVIRTGTRATQAAVDHVRSIPLFYAREDDRAYVSDDAQWILGQLDTPGYDRQAETELTVAGLVSGRDTLVPAIKQLQAGECVELSAGDIDISCDRSRPIRYRPDPPDGRTLPSLRTGLKTALEGAIERLVAVADGRPIAVSLSGGVDSRLVASQLAASNYDRVLTFSFGRPGNSEAEAAQEVADALGLPWTSVDYSASSWADWFNSERRAAYYRRAFNFDALPSLGAWPAMGELRRSGALPDDAVVVSGDAVTSTQEHIPVACKQGEGLDRAGFVDAIADLQYDLWSIDDDAVLRDRIADRWPGGDQPAPVAAAAVEGWDWAERQAKFIVSGDEYADWGYDWWLPLFDRELVAFWQRVPLEYRIDKRLHTAHADAMYTDLVGAERAAVVTADRPGAVDRMRAGVAQSPAGDVAKSVVDLIRPVGTNDPLGLLDIVPEELRQASVARRSVHSFKALELLGRVSFDGSTPSEVATNGAVPAGRGVAPTLPDRVAERRWFKSTTGSNG